MSASKLFTQLMIIDVGGISSILTPDKVDGAVEKVINT